MPDKVTLEDINSQLSKIMNMIDCYKKQNPVNNWISTSKAAEIANVNRTTILRWVKEGKVASKPRGRKNMVSLVDLYRFLN